MGSTTAEIEGEDSSHEKEGEVVVPSFDFEARAREKAEQRAKDLADLEAGLITREELKQRVSAFAFPKDRIRVRWDLVKKFC